MSSPAPIAPRGTPAASRLGRLGRAVVCLGVALLLSACTPGGNDGDSLYESADGRFRVLMPDDREESTQKVVTPAGELDATTVTGVAPDDVVFGVYFTDIPEQTGVVDVEAAFEGAVGNSAAAAPGLAVTYRNRTFAYGGPAMDYTLEGFDRQIRARVAIVGRRIYLIQYIGPNGATAEERFSRYIDTFEVLTKKEAAELASAE